jgi:hypothetical protein
MGEAEASIASPKALQSTVFFNLGWHFRAVQSSAAIKMVEPSGRTAVESLAASSLLTC